MRIDLCDILIGTFVFFIGSSPLIVASNILFYKENLHYEEVVKFIRNNHSCNFTQQEFQSHMQDKQSNYTASCLILTTLDNTSFTSSVSLSSVNVTFNVDGVKYNFDIRPSDCKHNLGSGTVEFKLFCDLAKDSNGATCSKETECEAQTKYCHHFDGDDTGLCIARRTLYDTCNEDSQCIEGTTCKLVDRNKICYCYKGHQVINNKCLPGNRRLYQSCEVKEQCKGTVGATECTVVAGTQMCYCRANYSVIGEGCLKVGVIIGETCIVDHQCTGTENGGRCVFNATQTAQNCDCNEGFFRFGTVCLQAGRQLLESCDHATQCNGTANATVCKLSGNTSLCYCNADMIEFNGRCLEAERQLHQTCIHHSQCTGTVNATVCRSFGLESSCHCNEGVVDFDGQCIEGGKTINRTCETDRQCTGTLHAGVCGENDICTCDSGFIEIFDECVRGNITLGAPCKKSLQCKGTKHSGRCLDGECVCDDGYVKQGFHCEREDQSTHNIINGYLLVGVISFLFGALCSFLAAFKIFRLKKNTKKERLAEPISSDVDDSHSYTYAVQTGVRNATEFLIDERSIESQNYKYNHLHHFEEQMTENVYDPCLQLPFSGEQNQTVDIYNKLREEETSLSQNIYDVSNSVSEPSSSQNRLTTTIYDFAKPLS